MNFEPLGDRVVIRPDEKVYAEKSGGGIDLLPGDEKEAQSGIIVAVGGDVETDEVYGSEKNPIRRAFLDGRRVVYSPWTGFAITIGGETFKILNESEIMGILTDSQVQVEVA